MCRDFKKGDILNCEKHEKSEGYHPIIFLEDRNVHTFFGCMLTSSSNFNDNIPLPEYFIKTNDSEGNDFLFQHKNTHIVMAKLIKKKAWKPYKVGELTIDGIQFIEEVIEKKSPQFWKKYKNK